MAEENNCRMTILLPLLILCVAFFLALLYKSVRTIISSRAVRKRLLLMTIYVAVNTELLLYTFTLMFVILGFTRTGELFSHTEHIFICIALYALMARIIQTTQKLGLSEMNYRILIGSCWAFLAIILISGLPLFFIQNTEYKFAYYLTADIVSSVYPLIVFVVFSLLLHAKAHVCLICYDKTIAGFFLIQIIGHIEHAIYKILGKYIPELLVYDSYPAGFCHVLSTLSIELIPSLLLIMIISKGAQTSNKPTVKVDGDTSISIISSASFVEGPKDGT